MRWVAGGAAVLFVSLCWGIRDGRKGQIRTQAAVSAPSSEPTDESLRQLIQARERELEALRTRLRELEKGAGLDFYREAQALGIARAVQESGLPQAQQQRIAIAIVRESRLHGLDPLLVVALIRAESSFDNYARSKVGALGLMQVMPETGKSIAAERGKRLVRKTHLFDSELNVEIGTAYLASLIRRFGTLDAALVAYNAGPTAARRILADRAAKARFLAGYPRKVVRELQKLRAGIVNGERAEGNAPSHQRRGESLLL